jgi:hypothetical protein
VEELYGCDPSAAGYAMQEGAEAEYGEVVVDESDAWGSAPRTPSRSERGGGGGGGGKTRTRCRTLQSGPLDSLARGAALSQRRSAFGNPQPSAFTGQAPTAARSSSGNKRLERKKALQTVHRRAPPSMGFSRRKADTSDDDDEEHTYTAELVLYAPSPALRPARAPMIIPGQFVLPLQAEVEDATELLLMGFELSC